MKLVFASDSFKGTVTSEQTVEYLTKAAHEVFGPCETIGVPVADGGEGTTDAVILARKGEKIYEKVCGPLMEEANAYYGRLSDTEVVLEMYRTIHDHCAPGTVVLGCNVIGHLAAGLVHMNRTGDDTSGVAWDRTRKMGVNTLAFRMLHHGAFYAAASSQVRISGTRGTWSDMSGLDEKVKNAHFTVMCDVTNPLCGKDGATYTFGKQKGGTPEILDRLENGMCNYRDVIIRQFGVNPDDTPGTGAAGGLGAALKIFLNAEMKSGIETVLDLIDFDKLIENADLIVTGEGRTDWQSCFGKVMQGVGDRAKKHSIPAVALCGGLGEGYEKIYEHGIDSIMTTVDGPMPLSQALDEAESLYYKGAIRMFRMVRAGMKLK